MTAISGKASKLKGNACREQQERDNQRNQERMHLVQGHGLPQGCCHMWEAVGPDPVRVAGPLPPTAPPVAVHYPSPSPPILLSHFAALLAARARAEKRQQQEQRGGSIQGSHSEVRAGPPLPMFWPPPPAPPLCTPSPSHFLLAV